jgi:hypothetical protein
MAIEETRLYELDDQVTLTDTDKIVVDKLGNTEAKSSFMLSVWNYIATKITLVTDFIGLSDVPASYTNKAYHKLYVKSDESGLEFKGQADDYIPLPTSDATHSYYVELNKVNTESGSALVGNATSSIQGVVAYGIRAVSEEVPAGTDFIPFYDVANNEMHKVKVNDIGGGGENIATNDLEFTANSTTDFAGYKATFDNAELKIIADANTVSDVPFEITQANGTDSIMKVTGNKSITFTGENFNHLSTDFGASYFLSGTGQSSYILAVNGAIKGTVFVNNNEMQITHNTGFIQYTCRDGLTADENLGTNRVTFAYDNVTNDFKIKFKKDDGTVITKTIS